MLDNNGLIVRTLDTLLKGLRKDAEEERQVTNVTDINLGASFSFMHTGILICQVHSFCILLGIWEN